MVKVNYTGCILSSRPPDRLCPGRLHTLRGLLPLGPQQSRAHGHPGGGSAVEGLLFHELLGSPRAMLLNVA